jgi:hypothetical protein
MKERKRSKLLLTIFGFNIFQFFIILIKPGEGISWPFVMFITIPLLYVNYQTLNYNKVAYTLLTYWFGVQVISFDFGDHFGLSLSYGVIYRIMLFNDTIGLNPLATLLFVLCILELDNVYFYEDEDARPVPQKDETNGLASGSN